MSKKHVPIPGNMYKHYQQDGDPAILTKSDPKRFFEILCDVDQSQREWYLDNHIVLCTTGRAKTEHFSYSTREDTGIRFIAGETKTITVRGQDMRVTHVRTHETVDEELGGNGDYIEGWIDSDSLVPSAPKMLPHQQAAFDAFVKFMA